eukprot:Rhum_TRINITY_DN7812_c0_g1::Rhum_TRINITY_DN7812_c0_g1_i1::g.24749::m.24749
MVLMTRNLKEYKAYMPQSVLAESSDVAETEGEGCREGPSASVDPSSSMSSSLSTGAASLMLAQEANAGRAGVALAISRRRCTFVVVNLVDFHAKASVLTEKKTVEAHGKALAAVLTVGLELHGICDGFSGDRFLLSFNGLKALATHRVAGCTAGVMLRA